MKKWIIISVLLILVLSSCSPAAGPAQPAPIVAEPKTANTPAATLAPDTAAGSSYCQGDVCVADLLVQTDGEYLTLFAEMENEMGGFLMLSSPQFSRDLNINLGIVDGHGKENSLFVGKLASDEIQCYTGDDIPWLTGKMATVCGYGFLLSNLSAAVNAGDQIHIQLPEFGNLSRVLTLEKE